MSKCKQCENCYFEVVDEELKKAITVREYIEQLKNFDVDLKILVHDDWSEFALKKESTFVYKCKDCGKKYLEINVT